MMRLHKLSIFATIAGLCLVSVPVLPAKADNTNVQLKSRTGNNCLDANTGALGRPAYMRPCDNHKNTNLLWDFVPANDGSSLFL